MATSGQAAWEKHFKPKFVNSNFIKTVVGKSCSLYDADGRAVDTVLSGNEIIVLKTETYQSRTPVSLNEKMSKVYYMTFDNIRKPQGKNVSGVKIKPQDFNSTSTKTSFTVDELSKGLLEDLTENRTDLDTNLNYYLCLLVEHWSGRKDNKTEIKKVYPKVKVGIAETAKDFGELLGAMACVKKNILPVKVPSKAKISIPRAGNEPLVDYYLVDDKFAGGKLAISAKSGTTTNTLKPKDIIDLLNTSGKVSKWKQKEIYKLMEMVVSTPTVLFPFVAINFITNKKILSTAALEEAKKFKVADFGSKKYKSDLFVGLFDLIGYSIKKIPSMGELFYATEKYIITTANNTEKFKPTAIFEEATSGAVTYVKYEITSSKPEGEFKVMITEGAKQDKKDIKWRSKNATNRAADKIGLQP